MTNYLLRCNCVVVIGVGRKEADGAGSARAVAALAKMASCACTTSGRCACTATNRSPGRRAESRSGAALPGAACPSHAHRGFRRLCVPPRPPRACLGCLRPHHAPWGIPLPVLPFAQALRAWQILFLFSPSLFPTPYFKLTAWQNYLVRLTIR